VWNSHPSGDGEGIFRPLDLEGAWRDGYSGLKCGGCGEGGRKARVLQRIGGRCSPTRQGRGWGCKGQMGAIRGYWRR